jgi:hypothetical protein
LFSIFAIPKGGQKGKEVIEVQRQTPATQQRQGVQQFPAQQTPMQPPAEKKK